MKAKCHILFSLLFLATWCSAVAKNHDFKVDGIYYKIIASGEVEVTYEKEKDEKNYNKLPKEIIIPAQVRHKGKNYTVTKIGKYAFYKASLESVRLPNTVKEIADWAFCDAGLSSISLPDSLETVGEYALCVCRFATISLPESITSIGAGALSACYYLHEVKLPPKLTVISDELFASSGIKKVEMPAYIEKIGDYAFAANTDLEEIVLPASLKSIGLGAFNNCKKLKEIYLPDCVKTVEGGAFDDSPTKVSYYCDTEFEWPKPKYYEVRKETESEIAERNRIENERKAEKERKQQILEAERKEKEAALRKSIKWAANVPDAKKTVIQAAYDDMVFVDGGAFQMGAKKAYKTNVPGHTVTLSPYLIGKYSVDQTLWSAVMGYNPSKNPSDNGPVDNVSWNDCKEFIKKLRQMTGIEWCLPTEAQWEYAAKGGSKSRGYLYAGTNNSDDLYKKNRRGAIVMLPNELGLYGMSGGVYEWCADWFGPYSDIEAKNPKGPAAGNGRVLRSGDGTTDYGGNIKQVTHRSWGGQAYRSGSTGLRLAVSPEYREEKILTPEQQARLNHPLLKKVVWAKGLSADRREIIADAIADMVKVEGGTYTFRGRITEYIPSNIPYGKELRVRTFYINKFEVSNKLWDAVFPGYDTFYRPKGESARNPEGPVGDITPEEIAKFIQQLNRLTGLTFALPSEAQWEFAARGGNQSMGYAYAGTNDKSKVGLYAKTRIPNELGLYDMTGGVWELVSDRPYSSGYKMRVDIWRGGPETIYERWQTTFIPHDGKLGFRLVLNIRETPARAGNAKQAKGKQR